MAGRHPAQAVENFLTPLQRAVSCVTPGILLLSPKARSGGGPHAVTLGGNEPQPLRGEGGLAIRLAQQYEVIRTGLPGLGPWKVRTLAYSYSIELADDETELFTFHWHPTARGAVAWPHLHVRGEHRKLHVPTGRVAIEQVIALAVEMGCEPLRDDWQTVLENTLGRHLRFRTWSDRAPS